MSTINWDEKQGHCHKIDCQKGKLRIKESGFYYIYTKTCFRHSSYGGAEDGGQTRITPVELSNILLIQYVYRESIRQNGNSMLLMKTGSTMRWNSTSYNFYCAQQGQGVRMEEGDALYVNVSNAGLLDPEPQGTYIGAIKLGN